MVDVPRLRKALEHITSHPEEWDQSRWAKKMSCDTAFCLAGHIVVQAHGQEDILFARTFIDDIETAEFIEIGEETKGIETEARDLLGIDWKQGWDLFHPLNTLEQLWQLANQYTDGEIEVPADLPAA